jgi:hypothetical protein
MAQVISVCDYRDVDTKIANAVNDSCRLPRLTGRHQRHPLQSSRLGLAQNQTRPHWCAPQVERLLLSVWHVSILYLGCMYVRFHWNQLLLIDNHQYLIHASLTKAWSWITATIQFSLIISKIQRQIYSSTLMKTMPYTAQCHQHSPQRLFSHCLWMAHLRSLSQLGIAEKKSTLPTNWKSILNYQQKISNLATQFSGGLADEVNFCASFSWRATFYVFLVSNFNSHNSNLNWSVTGSAVAVERIFSGGRDTISLQRASLQADIIRILMLVKKHLHLVRQR